MKPLLEGLPKMTATFTISKIPEGNVLVIIQYIGFKTITKT